MNGEWKPLIAACMLILCVGLAFGLAVSPCSPLSPYGGVSEGERSSGLHESARTMSPDFLSTIIPIAAAFQAIAAIGTLWLIGRRLKRRATNCAPM